jgi:hypothetical protein
MAAKSGRRRAAGRKPKRKVAAKRRKPARKTRPKARKSAVRKTKRQTRRRARSSRKAPRKPRGSAFTLLSRGKPARLDRERRRLEEADELIPGPPSTLGFDAGASAARTGHEELRERISHHTETGPALTGGDVDADWQDAYSVGDEAPGGDNPTPDQDRVDDIGRALGVEYEDNEELKGAGKLEKRDRNRWELDPASAEDYKDRSRD